MPADLFELLKACRTLEESSASLWLALDRQTLLTTHKVLATLKREVEAIIEQSSFDRLTLN